MTNSRRHLCRDRWRWNLFFRMIFHVAPLLMLASFIAGSDAYGVNLDAVYYASCKREVGVIVHVDNQKIAILSLDGEIREIDRYEVIYLAQYPMGEIPIEKVSNADKFSGITIKTLFNKEIVTLVKGWPVNFSDKNIAFLSLDGQESIIDRDSIWKVEPTIFEKKQSFPNNSKSTYEFVHPYPFSKCPRENLSKSAKEIFPQQLLGDRLIIKNEFDRLMLGYEQMVDYSRDQRFYPVPQIYPNTTSLSIWYNYGSRHGRSDKRSNSLVPAVTSKLSEGPFGFQRIMVTGAAPLNFSLHEEPQTQFYYRLKADYVHFSYFYDIDRLLIGEEPYKWRIDDLDKYDDRMNEVHHLSGGFDYSRYAIGLTYSTVQYGVRHEEAFFVHRAEMMAFDFSYEDRHLEAHLYYGQATDSKDGVKGGKDDDDEEEADEEEPVEVQEANEALSRVEELKPDFLGKIRFVRLNLNFKHILFQPRVSLIYRELQFYLQEDDNLENEITYASKSFTGSVYLNYQFDDDIGVSTYVSLEGRKNRSGVSFYEEKSEDYFPKAGINWSLTF